MDGLARRSLADMKFFVTDAQIAALRVAISQDLQRLYAEQARAMSARYDAELARLADPAAPFVAHLRAEIDWYRAQLVHERQRAEVAIDQCRVTHQNVGPATMPPRPVTAEAMPTSIEELLRNTELGQIGGEVER